MPLGLALVPFLAACLWLFRLVGLVLGRSLEKLELYMLGRPLGKLELYMHGICRWKQRSHASVVL